MVGTATRGSDRRGLIFAVIGCLGSAVVLLLASGQTWLTLSLPARVPLPAATQTLTGQDVVEVLTSVGILVGAAGLALIATGRIGRLVVAAAVVGAGLLVLATVGFFLYDDGRLQALAWEQSRATAGESLRAGRDVVVGPATIALLAGGCVVVVGIFTLKRARSWPSMGARYERGPVPASPSPGDPASVDDTGSTEAAAGFDPATTSDLALWAAIERGEDPTAGPLDVRTDR